ncbi:MAG: formylglycine-generating enzyme family protein, partial [Bacteroidales bacterium]|nr:formylglycine-generating enzyme family protein [Bacteroidales bacterium]
CWEDAREFCKKLSEQTGKKYVLPTEAQWEYAARGGVHKTKKMHAGSNDIDEVAWYYENSYGLGSEHPDCGTHPVGTKKANALGIYDMSGNVWEWCSDWYMDRYDKADDYNPQGPDNGSSRVSRGGSWLSYAVLCRVSYRYFINPDNRFNYLGFRVAVLP